MRSDVASCLDEIDVCYDRIEKGIPKAKKSTFLGWAKKKKDELKALGYKGKIRRLKKTGKNNG